MNIETKLRSKADMLRVNSDSSQNTQILHFDVWPKYKSIHG